jgi:hypothetical protein
LRLYLQILFRVARTSPGKKFAEVLDLSQSVKTHGFGTEPRLYISKNETQKMKQAKETLSKPCIREMVKKHPTEITFDEVILKMKEFKIKQLSIKNTSLSDLIKIYNNTLNFDIVIHIIFELNFRSNKISYTDLEVQELSNIFYAHFCSLKELKVPKLLSSWKEQLKFHIKEKKDLHDFIFQRRS